jgi:exopolysaccharide production protein ExoZ
VTRGVSLTSIQCLRGIAALLVVLSHALQSSRVAFHGQFSALNGLFHLREFGTIGVDIFFVISGFIMVYVNHEAFGKPRAPIDFLARRIIRICPLYWLLTGLMVLLLFFTPRAFNTLTFQPVHVVESLLFIPTMNSAGEYVPVLVVGWTLSYEMYFYFLFAILLPTSLRWSLVLTGALFILTTLIGYWRPPEGPVSHAMFSPILLEFVFGECLAFWLLRGQVLAPRAAVTLVMLVLAIFIAQIVAGPLVDNHLLDRGLPSAALVFALVCLEHHGRLRFPAWLKAIGDESYSLYLSHVITMAVLSKLWVALHVTRWLPVDAWILLAVVFAVFCARGLYQRLERPMTVRLHAAWRDLSGAGLQEAR